MILKQIPEDFIVEEIPIFDKLLDKGKYLIFSLEKKNFDTEKVIQILSKIFKIQRKFFNYAGSKDRKAITKQYCSLKIIENKKIKDFEKYYKESYFKIKVLGYLNEPLSLGSLKGNKFTITLRDLSEKDEHGFFNHIKNRTNEKIIKEQIEFVNYFDEQRFSKNNYEIGYSLIKKDFKKATDLIDLIEVKLHLDKNKKDYVGALKKVPFKILTMYINSVQSYLFNEVCAEYIKKKAKNYFEIDYVLSEADEKKIKKFFFCNEKIKNIEIPLISFDTDLSNLNNDKKINNELKKIYESVLNREKIYLNDFVIRQFPELTVLGSKRNLIATAKDFEIISFENDELNKNKKKIKISFFLDKGSYATVFVKFLSL
ncbi:MAG: tRNA pseudouridine(13) synthase TruD [Candidatus Woesearchaeota archaeon]